MIVGTSRVFGTPATDGNFANTVLLMGFDGTVGTPTVPATTDFSNVHRGNGTASGTCTISSSQSKFGGTSCSFSGGIMTFPDSADFYFGSGSYTVEFFLFLNATGFQFIVGQWQSFGTISWIIYEDSGKIKLNVSTTGSDNINDVVGVTTLSTGTWYHVCVDCDGTNTRLYINGAMDFKSTTPRTLFDAPIQLAMGGSATGSFPLNGFLDELRITKGVARYASDSGFTVPTSAYPRS